jgi:predicted small metal-binding protein
MARKSIDCRDYPDETGCTLFLAGEEDEVIRAAAAHAVAVHGQQDIPELHEWLRSNLKDESAIAHA